MWRAIFSTSLQHTLYFIFIFYYFILIFFLSPHFSPPSSIHRDRCKPPPQAATGSVTHATNTSRSTTHNPKPPPTSHPRHKHLKIGNPITTPTTPPPHRDRRKPPHPGRDQQANPNSSPRRANPHPDWRRDRQLKPTSSKPKPNHHKGEQRRE